MSRKEHVTNVIDGDTFETSRRKNPVRLADVDAPGLGTPGGREAKRALEALIGGKTVLIDTVVRDQFGLSVASVKIGRRSVNKAMSSNCEADSPMIRQRADNRKGAHLPHMMQLGSRLRVARDRRGLSQHAVAAELGLPRTAVVKIESGVRAVSTFELAKLAAIYRRPPAFFLAADEEPETGDLSAALGQALPEIEQAPEVEAEIWRLVDLCREGATLRRMLDQATGKAIPDYAGPMKKAADAVRQGEDVAREERRRLALGNAPIGDVTGLIGDQGIWSAATELPDGTSGLFVKHPGAGPIILVNRQYRYACRRFSYLHEYAHVLFDSSEIAMATRRENSSELAEKRANAFASAFLMPPEGIGERLAQIGKGRPSRRAHVIFDVAGDSTTEAELRARPGSQAIAYQDVATLARRFGVDFEMAVWRLKNLNHINAEEAATLEGQKGIGDRYARLLGFRDLPEEAAASESPGQEIRSRLMGLALEAFRQEEISGGRLVELGRKLGIGRDEASELAFHLDTHAA